MRVSSNGQCFMSSQGREIAWNFLVGDDGAPTLVTAQCAVSQNLPRIRLFDEGSILRTSKNLRMLGLDSVLYTDCIPRATKGYILIV